MAFTFTDFKKAMRAQWGRGQTNVSGDGGGDVKDHTDRLVSRIVRAEYPATNSLTDAIYSAAERTKVLFTAEEECDVVAIRVAAAGSLTVSVTDHVLLTVIKRKATTFSVTESVATCTVGATSTWTLKPGFSRAATIATTASVIDMDPGDSLVGTLSRAGGVVQLQTPLTVMLTVREK